MPRPVKDAKLNSRAARARLKPRDKPHYRALDHELHLGYRKGKSGGRWVRRSYLGGQRYEVATLGTADDHAEADGVAVLDWRQAQALAREHHAAALRRLAGAGPCTVADACRDYVADLRARKGERAAREAEGRLAKHVPPELGGRQVADLTPGDLTTWRNGMVAICEDPEEVRRSRDTANRMRSILFAALNHAFHGGKVPDDRAWRRVRPFRDVGAARKVILSDAEQQRLVDACEPGLKEFALLAALTGARPGRELTEARVRDLDPGQATLRVSGKTGTREIHLPPAAVALLRRMASGRRPDDHLLTTAAGAPWSKSLHARRVAAAVAKAGLDPATNLYALRHSYISRALKAGVPTKAVADQCGTSMAMIQRHYAKFIPTDLAGYATAAAPPLELEPAATKVVAIGAAGR